MEPIFSGVLFTFACVGVYAFGAQKNGAQAFSTVQKHGDFKLEVDITGRGNWVEQGRGPSKEVND